MSKIEITKDVTIVVGEDQAEGVMHVRANTDAGFSKLWVDMMMLALGITGSSKAAVIGYLLKNRGRDNRVHGSFDEIAEAAQTGRATVARTMKALQKEGLVERERDGVYLINPAWIWDGSHQGRMMVLMEFKKLSKPAAKVYNLDNSEAPTPEQQKRAARG